MLSCDKMVPKLCRSFLTTSVVPCCYYGVYIGGGCVLTEIYWISLKPLPPTSIAGHLSGGGGHMSCVPPQKGPSVIGREGGVQNHSTSCLFLQRLVETEREFLNSLFLTNLSTFVLYGIPLLEFILVASSILYIPFFSCAYAFYLSACVPHLRCNYSA